MVTDFALRGVVLQDIHERAPDVHDLFFRRGRLTSHRPTPACAGRRLFLSPGFRDAHHHLLQMGLTALRCDLTECTSLSEALDRVADYVRRQPPEPAVVWAERWDESRWPEGRAPTRDELDRVAPDRPLVFRRICGHRILLNTTAATRARETFGRLGPDDEPTEQQALGLTALWPPTPAELEQALVQAQETAVAVGITRVGEMGGYRALETYVALSERGGLRIDVELFIPPDRMETAVALRERGAFAGPRLRLGGVKLYTDGSVGARTAALRAPYADTPSRGELLYADDQLCAELRRCLEADLRVAIHAIGDAAILQVIDQVERLRSEGQKVAGRVRMEHAEMIDEPMLDRALDLGIDLSMQPNFMAQWSGRGGLYERALGRERTLALNPLRSVWDRDLALLFGSDGMPMDPAVGLRGAVHHPNEAQRLTAEEALRAYLGARSAPGGFWTQEDWWEYGRADAVLHAGDPLDLASGDRSASPILAVLWDGEWLLEPPPELYRTGVIHVL